MDTELLQLGAMGIIFIFAIREFFAWLKRRNENGETAILKEVQLMNENHLHSIEEAIKGGNQVQCNNQREMIKILSRIEGQLKK